MGPPPPPVVTIVGSLHYDIILDAPDRPRKGETLVGRSWASKFGGKGGNQAVAAARRGARTHMVGAVGDDAFGAALLGNLARAGIDCRHVARIANAKSGMSVAIFDDDGDYGAVIVSGVNLAIDAAAVESASAVIGAADVLILQNEIPDIANVAAARTAREAGVRTLLNAAPARLPHADLPGLIDVLIVNAIEAEMLGGGAVAGLDDAAAAAHRLLDRFAAVVVTAGGAGVAFADRSGARLRVEAVKVKVASTHGAGDAFVGTLAAVLGKGRSMAEAVADANAAAAAIVATPEADRV